MDCPKRNALAGLPDEAMLEILARTPFRSVCRSKCVAKAWRDLIDDPLNRRRLPQTLQGFISIFDRIGPGNIGSSDLEHIFVKYLTSPVPLDIDPCFSFLTRLPDIERLYLVDSCNGLFLFKRCMKSSAFDVLGYIVCNPTTKHWATVPLCACCFPSAFPSRKALVGSNTYLAFDPAVSSHFHLIQFWRGACGEEDPLALSVHAYSSETGVWSHSQTDWNEQEQLEGWRRQGSLNHGSDQRIFVNGILHLMVSDKGRHQNQIVAVDVQGRTKRTIKLPAAAKGRRWHSTPCIGQSQGRLHYINQDFDAHESRKVHKQRSFDLSIWELQDYETQEWVLKDTVSFFRLFMMVKARRQDFKIAAIHPDRNVVFFHKLLNKRVIAYDMDSKEVSVVAMLSGNSVWETVPYIPCFSELPALTNKN